MTYKVKITKTAAKDLDDSLSYIDKTLKNTQSSKDLLTEFYRQASKLKESPKIHQVVGYLPTLSTHQEIRFFRVKKYLAFYVIDEEKKSVSIIRFLYEKRDWNNTIVNQA